MDDETPAPPGHKLGRVILDLLIDGLTASTIRSAPHLNAERLKASSGWLEDLEREMTPTMQATFQQYVDDGNLRGGLEVLLGEVVDPQHQFGAILDLVAGFAMLIGGIGPLGSVGVTNAVNELWRQFPDKVLDPADVADLVERNLWSLQQGYDESAMSGLNGDRFDALVAVTGEPPGPVDMLSLWRRGLISQEYLEQAIRFSRIKDLYIPDILNLAHSYMSPADVVNLAIKGLVTPDEAQTMFGIAGGLEDQWPLIYQGAGDAIGNEQANALYNHGFITQQQVYEVYGRSRMNPLFYDLAFMTRHKFLSVIQIQLALKAGTATQAEATQWLTEDGYPADQIAAFVAGAAGGAATKAKTETEAMVVQQYVDLLIDEPTALAQLEQLGYVEPIANAILSAADAKRAHAQLSTAVSAVKSAFLDGRITAPTVLSDLARLDIPAAAANAWLNDWTVELGTRKKTLTMAQVGGLLKKQILSADEAMSRWFAMGYDAADCQLLAQDYGASAAGVGGFSG